MSIELKPEGLYKKYDAKWSEAIQEWLLEISELVQKKIEYERLGEYQQELQIALGASATFLYYTRKLRDRDLAEAYRKYPKVGRNSEEQIALARNEASNSVRLHELVKDLAGAIKERISSNQSLMRWRNTSG